MLPLVTLCRISRPSTGIIICLEIELEFYGRNLRNYRNFNKYGLIVCRLHWRSHPERRTCPSAAQEECSSRRMLIAAAQERVRRKRGRRAGQRAGRGACSDAAASIPAATAEGDRRRTGASGAADKSRPPRRRRPTTGRPTEPLDGAEAPRRVPSSPRRWRGR